MMHFRRLVLLLCFLPAGARRSTRISDSLDGLQQHNNILANGLDVSAESGEALIPGSLPPLPRLVGPRAGAARSASLELRDYGIASSPLAKLAISAIEANQRRNQGRDAFMIFGSKSPKKVAPKRSAKKVAAKKPKKVLSKGPQDAFSNLDDVTKKKLLKVINEVDVKVRDSLKVGITDPLGFFDPIGFATNDISAGRLLFYREVELKHGRVAMLASLGFLVGEQFHPLFGGDIDVPSYIAFQETPLQTFWPAVVVAVSLFEIFSVGSFQNAAGNEPWSMLTDRRPGDFGFDPLGLRPEDPNELNELQTKELNNGRLAMIGIAGMVAQELASGQKLF